MQRSNSIFSSFIKTAACAVLVLGAVAAQAADATGTWTWSTPGRNGGPDRKSTLTLKADGAKLTGKLSAPGRGGRPPADAAAAPAAAPAPVETEITDGKVDKDMVSFTVTREVNNNKIVSKYSGKLDGDTIKGKVETEGGQGGGGPRDWEAKREMKKDDKK